MAACGKICSDPKTCEAMDDTFVAPSWSSQEGNGQKSHSSKNHQACKSEKCNMYFYADLRDQVCKWCFSCPKMKNDVAYNAPGRPMDETQLKFNS